MEVAGEKSVPAEEASTVTPTQISSWKMDGWTDGHLDGGRTL